MHSEIFSPWSNRRYELFIDDLPMWGFVGEMKSKGQEEEAYIFTHKIIDISYNKERVGFLLFFLTPAPNFSIIIPVSQPFFPCDCVQSASLFSSPLRLSKLTLRLIIWCY